MTQRWSGWAGYALAGFAVVLTMLGRNALGPGDEELLFELFLLPILLSAYLGGLGPGLVATAVAGGVTIALHPQILAISSTSRFELAEWLILVLIGALVSWLLEDLHRSRQRAETSRQLQAVTLASIGDAVITTDMAGRITFLNPEAERLTGWGLSDATGRPLREVFRIVNEQTHAPVEDPAALVMRTGKVVGLANHTMLQARDGTEYPIDDSGAPIRQPGGPISGVVLVFRDVSAQKRAEEAVLRSERTLKLFVEHAPAAIAMFDREMRYIAASRRFLSDYHLPPEPIVGRTHYEVFPEIPERWRAIHRRCLAGATEHCAEDPFPRADGSIDWVRWELHPWFGRPGEVGGLVLFSEVITERKLAEAALRESEARFHQTLDSMLEGCQIISFDWRYLYVNMSALEHGRMTRDALLGRTMMEVFPGIEATPLFEVLRRSMEERRPQRLENRFIYADGSFAWFDLSVQPSPEGLFILSIDITERKQADELLAAERALLTERVEARTADLRIANTELARAARLKDEFLANMSHELRTPLNAILGRTELLQEQIYGPITPRQAEALRTIDASGQHLLALINDVLDLSKITAGKLEVQIEPVDAELLCARSTHMVAQSALQRQIQLSTSLDPQVRTINADERRLKQILVNLLSNAVKFTPEGGQVGLQLVGDPAAQTATFTVWDTGIGIAGDQLARLFQPFSQVDSGLNRHYSGTGLGLSLVLRLAEAHGGSVAVKSAPGQGSRFSVTLPWNTPAQEPLAPVTEPEPAAAPPDAPGTAVLLVEDNEANSQLMLEHLSAHGFAVSLARDGLEALELALAEPPAAILMDIQMPGMDGLEATRRIRADPKLRRVPIIALTALAMPGDRERCLAAGADAYLTKPVSLRTVLMTLNGLIAERTGRPAPPQAPGEAAGGP